jgi:hypothetical protein
VLGAVATTAVVAGTAGAVHHRQEQRWANKEAQAYQAEAAEQAQMQAQMQAASNQADIQDMQAQMAAQQQQLALQQQQLASQQMAAQQVPMQQPMQQPMPMATPAAAPAPDRITQLRQLGEMKEAGILTDAEFEAEKAKLLASG